MQINKIDVYWNYLATFFKIATSILLLPLILKYLPSEDVAMWTIFTTISGLIFLLDFGFHSSFVRNVSYVFGGIHFLEKEGISNNLETSNVINYSLFKGLIETMKWFYTRVSLLLLFLLLFFGSFYINLLLKGFDGNKSNIWIAWVIFCLINTYNLYTLYYESLMEGRGLIRLSKKITIIGNVVYLTFAVILVITNFGLVAIVFSQLLSVLIIRFFSYRSFFDKELIQNLDSTEAIPSKEILKTIFPNAYKYGITSLGGFMIQKASIFIGSLYLPLDHMASFGISKQILDVIIVIANITLATYIPKITHLRIERNTEAIKGIYLRGIVVSNLLFIVGALLFVFIGPLALEFIGSKTSFVSMEVLTIMAISCLIGLNAGISGAVIATKNVIPFMMPSIYSGIATVVLLMFFFKITNLGLLGLALAPGIIDLCYQGWKWPYEVCKDLNITLRDVKIAITKFKL